MFGEREEIIRLNIERFERLLIAEADTTRRQMLARLLAEARAELEFLGDTDGVRVELRAWRVSEERIRHLRRKAEDCRSVARTYRHHSTRDFFSRLADEYESAANEAERSGASANPDGAGPSKQS